MVFINQTDVIGALIYGLNDNVFGSMFLTLVALMIFLIVLCLAIRIPIEATAIFLLPLFLSLLAYSTDFGPIAGAFLIYLAILFGKWFFLNE